jgi:type II secretory pathway pseudopilin PulG
MITDEGGITIIELLIVAAIVGVGIVGVMTVVPLSSYGVYEGAHLSTATFLAEQKLEELKNARWQATPANDCLGLSTGNGDVAPTSTTCTRTDPTPCTTGAMCSVADDETAVAGYPDYGRTIRIVDCATWPGGCGGVVDTNMRRIILTVTYRPLTGVGASTPTTTKPVVLVTDVSRR